MPLPPMPKMWRVRQRLHDAAIGDVGAAVRAEFARLHLEERVRGGARIAITAGSRGIDRIPLVIAALVEAVRTAGGNPFIVPAMGTHGGATAEGQVALLESLGITPETAGAPILATMDVEQVGTTPEGIPVFLDRHAAAADGILVVNRVKQHADFSGPIESGVLKMIAIGLGKQKQAEAIHIHGQKGLRELIAPTARVTLAKAPILAGFALVEDGYHRLARIVGLPPEEIEGTERRLLRWAKRVEPRIPFDAMDVLIVDRIGKHLSGTGMDTKVIGRMRIAGAPELRRPHAQVLIARELARESHGNGVGVGLADIVLRRLVDQIDWHTTHTNALTTGFMERTKVGVIAEDDTRAMELALYLLRHKHPSTLRIVRIPDTLHLDTMEVSDALVAEAEARSGMVVDPEWRPLPGVAAEAA